MPIPFLCSHMYSCRVHNLIATVLWVSVQKLFPMDPCRFSVARLIFWWGDHHARNCIGCNCERENYVYKRMDAYTGLKINLQMWHVFSVLSYPNNLERTTMVLPPFAWSHLNSGRSCAWAFAFIAINIEWFWEPYSTAYNFMITHVFHFTHAISWTHPAVISDTLQSDRTCSQHPSWKPPDQHYTP